MTRLVDACGTRRRIEALHAAGWTQPDIAGAADPPVHVTRVSQWRHATRVHPDAARRVAAVYHQLAGRQGPSWRARLAARRAGAAPAEAWAGRNIDDPTVRPVFRDPVAMPKAVWVARVAAGNAALHVLPPAEQRDLVARLAARGQAPETIAARVGADTRTVAALLWREVG